MSRLRDAIPHARVRGSKPRHSLHEQYLHTHSKNETRQVNRLPKSIHFEVCGMPRSIPFKVLASQAQSSRSHKLTGG